MYYYYHGYSLIVNWLRWENLQQGEGLEESNMLSGLDQNRNKKEEKAISFAEGDGIALVSGGRYRKNNKLKFTDACLS